MQVYKKKPRRGKKKRQQTSGTLSDALNPSHAPVLDRIPNFYPTTKFKIARHVGLGTITLSNAGTTSGGFSMQLDEIPGYTELTSMFDRYRFCQVQVTFLYSAQNIQIQSSFPYAVVRFATVIDYNSSGTLASLNDAREFATCQINQFPSVHSSVVRKLVPKYLTGAENNASSIVVAGNSTGWLNTAATNIPHYGVRWFAEQLTTPYTGTMKCEAIYCVEFDNVK